MSLDGVTGRLSSEEDTEDEDERLLRGGLETLIRVRGGEKRHDRVVFRGLSKMIHKGRFLIDFQSLNKFCYISFQFIYAPVSRTRISRSYGALSTSRRSDF